MQPTSIPQLSTVTPVSSPDLLGSPFRRVRSPVEIKRTIPLSMDDQRRIESHRSQVRDVLRGDDARMLVVLGPCSIHSLDGAYDYARRLQALNEQVSDRLLLVMRAYFEKPRTTIGWKGYVADPRLDNSNDMDQGLEQSRQLLAEISRMGLPLATEALSPVVAEYLQDWISWTAIGARTTESQTHREMASGLDSIVGFKNATDGGLQVAIDAIKSAAHPHEYLGVDHEGRVAIRQTLGNPDTHIVLRGAKGAPNYDAESVQRCRAVLGTAGVSPKIMVDCSHDNSAKDYRRQPEVLKAVLEQVRDGERSLFGVMLESHLKEGQQKLIGCPSQLDPHQSITDGCIGWETTERLVREMYSSLG